ncbi:MAG: glycosyltransferase [Acidobacteria bacterium]|nr:glycosyltransferase [Acidobacteriota bacterium]MCB9397020.1 glycosyltransferase [Acidobacteriota bacterium]
MTHITKKPLSLCIIIVNWRAQQQLNLCLAGLQKWPRYAAEVIIIENEGTTTEPPPGATQFWSNPENEGFAFAVNQALKLTEQPFVLLLNPDCLIDEPTVLTLFERIQSDPNMAFIGPKVLDQDGHPVRACRRDFHLLGQLTRQYLLLDRWFSSAKRYDVSGVAPCIQGSVMMGRREMFLAEGGLDDRVPLYLDDMDLCKRAQDRGLTVWYEASVTAQHIGGVSVQQLPNPKLSSLVSYVAQDLYFLKHHSWLHVIGHHVLLLICSLIFLPLNLLLFPLALTRTRHLSQYLVKHAAMFCYAITFWYPKLSLPRHWPHSLKQALKKQKDLPSKAGPKPKQPEQV